MLNGLPILNRRPGNFGDAASIGASKCHLQYGHC